MNPAWMCKFERDQMGAEAFAEDYGENDNKANAFGKCVSREAHDRDGVTPRTRRRPERRDEETVEPGDAPEEERRGEPTLGLRPGVPPLPVAVPLLHARSAVAGPAAPGDPPPVTLHHSKSRPWTTATRGDSPLPE